jgi:hypothetical protein
MYSLIELETQVSGFLPLLFLQIYSAAHDLAAASPGFHATGDTTGNKTRHFFGSPIVHQF